MDLVALCAMYLELKMVPIDTTWPFSVLMEGLRIL